MARPSSLPPRTDELIDWVERGVRNKQVAWQLGGPEVDWVVDQHAQGLQIHAGTGENC